MDRNPRPHLDDCGAALRDSNEGQPRLLDYDCEGREAGGAAGGGGFPEWRAAPLTSTRSERETARWTTARGSPNVCYDAGAQDGPGVFSPSRLTEKPGVGPPSWFESSSASTSAHELCQNRKRQ